MTIRLTSVKLTGLAAGTLLFATASYAAFPVGGARVEPAKALVHAVQIKGDRGTLFRPPLTINPPPGPRVRDHRGEEPKFVVPSCGHHPRPCKAGIVRDHRSK